MKLEYAFMDSSYKHILYTKPSREEISRKAVEIKVLKEEKFAFQLMLGFEEDCTVSIGERSFVGWKGLGNRARIKVRDEHGAGASAHFVGYVKDDCGTLTADPILNVPQMEFEAGVYRMVWIEGAVSGDFEGDRLKLGIELHAQSGYGGEELIMSETVEICVADIEMPQISDSSFHMDLWQHPSSWARYYDVQLWSDGHWSIIENNIRELSSMGQKVVTIIASDYSWAGQSCYKFPKNASNLFEYNMVGVRRSSRGRIECDFSVVDKYIGICEKYGIDGEIDIFGIMGNWDGYSFGNPLEDYKDPVRVSIYDESSGGYSFIRSKEELSQYIEIVFDHFVEKGLWEKTFIMSDEPNNMELFAQSMELFKICAKGRKVRLKSALHDKAFLENSLCVIDSASLNLELTIKSLGNLKKAKESLNDRGGKLTWFVCCFPERPNNFIGSPLLENRLMGWLTYFFEMDGFLRWDYAIWPEDPWNEPSYKFPRWRAGDMFFVYPGKDMEPVRSLRWENLRLGIQDFQLFKLAESMGVKTGEIQSIMEIALGKKECMGVKEQENYRYEMKMGYSKEYSSYARVREEIIQKLTRGDLFGESES